MLSFAGALFGIFCFISAAQAETYTFDLSSSSQFNLPDSTGIVNTGSAQIEAAPAPNLGGGQVAADVFSFGDGSDGAFSDGPTQTGITVSGNTITFNTSSKSEFDFSSFNLSAGKTITVVGSNPLVLRVLGSTTIGGSFSLDGEDGADNAVTGPFPGGDGVASGGDGGAGGDIGAATQPSDGSIGHGSSLGGVSSANVSFTFTEVGASGGCLAEAGAQSNATAGLDAVAGNSVAPPLCPSTYATIAAGLRAAFAAGAAGGAGGGGGTACGAPSVDCSPAVSGSGGGGGGGALRISSLGAITLSAGAVLSARGGDGGQHEAAGASNDCGGGGGGGSGGSLWLQSATSVTGTGTIDTSGGAGGITLTCAPDPNAYDGGAGSRGVLRMDAPAVFAGTIDPDGASDDSNSLTYINGETYTVYSQWIDFTQGIRAFSGVVADTSACGVDALTISFQSSNDGSAVAETAAMADIADLDRSPYLRAKIDIDVTTGSPSCLSALSFDYDLTEETDLSLRGGLACGSMAMVGSRSPLFYSILDFLMLALAGLTAKTCLWWRRRRKFFKS